MFPRGQLRTVLALAVVAAVAQANLVEVNGRQEEQLQVRRGLLDSLVSGVVSGVDISATIGDATSSSSSSSSAIKTSSSSSQTSATTTTSSSSSALKTSSTSSTLISTSSSSSSATKSSSSQIASITSSSQTTLDTSTTTSSSSSVIPLTTEVVLQTTTIDGQVLTSSYTTTSGTTTATGALQDGTTSQKSTGMSAKTKTTVIGVVVGIGGAAIAAGLFVVAWKIWGRKKNEEEGDELMSNMGREKDSSHGNGPSNPFQSTLDQYHAPSRNVNASSNF